MSLSERIPLKGTINTRDLGGYVGKGGKIVKFKRIIRTDDLNRLTRGDINELISKYNPKWDIDLRSAGEAKKRPDREIPGCKYIRLPFHENDSTIMEDKHSIYHLSDNHLDHLIDFIYFMNPDGDVDKAMEKSNRAYFSNPKAIESLRQFLIILKDNKEGSVMFHCADGKDRTGFGAALLLSLLGVSKEDIIQDYLKTNENTKAKALRRKKFLEDNNFPNQKLMKGLVEIAGVKQNWLEAGLNSLEKDYGNSENFATKVLGFSEKDLEELRENYLQ